MAYAVFNDGATDGREPWVDYEFTDEPFVEVLGESAPGQTERVEIFACTRRRYRWPAGLTEAQRVAWEAFLQARGIVREAFLVEDPRDPLRELVALEPSTGDGARVTFSLPTAEASPDFRWYPKQGSVVGYVAGVPAAVASVDTTARTVTFAAPPAPAAAVAATYRGLRLVRLSDPPTYQGVTKRFGRYEFALEEVLRD
ncbi:MAG: DUF2460 domain-containing protein [Planctomycetota bacterium]|nr:DUF2460 domain-containing protein [Planctomycetota bacterium]